MQTIGIVVLNPDQWSTLLLTICELAGNISGILISSIVAVTWKG